MIESLTLYANGSVISRAIAGQAIAMAQGTHRVLLEDKGLRWKCPRRQLDMVFESGFANLSIPLTLADREVTDWQPPRYTICGILTIVDPRVPDDGLELWNGDRRLVVVSGLALEWHAPAQAPIVSNGPTFHF